MASMTSPPNGNPGGYNANGSAGAPFGASGDGGSTPAPKRPLPHIDDIKSVTIDDDQFVLESMDKVLTHAEDFLRQSETYRTFGRRIDMALASYLKACDILTKTVQKNKGWSSLQGGDNKAQKERYNRLLRQVKGLHRDFEQIKGEIQADNARTGVRPKAHHQAPGMPASKEAGSQVAKENKPSVSNGVRNHGISDPPPSFIHPKGKPKVHPKPEALHGNVIPPGADLTSRFAKLRAATSTLQQPGVQDPRIRTQLIVPPLAPPGHRPPVLPTARPGLSLDSTSINPPDLPKLPGAIYKPARVTTVSTEAAELPSSSSRRFSLARTLTSGSLNSSGVRSPTSGPGFAYDTSCEESTDGTKRAKPTIPEGSTISVTELLRLMKELKTVSILIIDIRSREAFDEGHIMSQTTICIEPEVLMRPGISASEIADSIVIAPSAEQINFERRHEFDLVVFYDQDSIHISTNKEALTDLAVQGLYNALTHYDFTGEATPKQPKLLEGGLDAWIGMLGINSLATAESSVTRTPKTTSMIARPSNSRPPRRKSHVPQPIQDADVARQFEEATKGPDNFTPITDLKHFFQTFPDISKPKESMISPPPFQSTDGTHGELPREPRPVRRRPSRNHFQVSSEPEESNWSGGRSQGGKEKKRKIRVGLRNPGNWCYANSSFQALFGTEDFARDLFSESWQRQYSVPKKVDERIPNPQLLAKMVSQLFAWMDRAVINPMEARTLMQYVRHIHGRDVKGRPKDAHDVFGSIKYQHDAHEFLTFLLDQLHDETNTRRDKDQKVNKIEDGDPRSLLHNAIRYWRSYTTKNDSIVTKYWRGMTTGLNICKECGNRTTPIEVFDVKTVNIPAEDPSLQKALKELTATELVTPFECTPCKKPTTLRKRAFFSRLPDRLVFHIMRTTSVDEKDNRRLEFPIRGLDMEPYFVPEEEREIDRTDKDVADMAKTDSHFRLPFIYDCYAVVCHIGKRINSGHYISYVRDQNSNDHTDWIELDDDRVRRIKVGSAEKDETELLYKKDGQSAFLVFYQRRVT